ncbi:MAG: Lar family restriction alleviation protein [Tritonibacter mobilis]|nr:Lar family restriction alleviation protein [Tritonibacter mobilis]
MATHDQRLKRCPFCGGACKTIKGHASEDVWAFGTFWRAYCTTCQARQLFHKTEASAIGAWNYRLQEQPHDSKSGGAK